jgi:hypothetical protein
LCNQVIGCARGPYPAAWQEALISSWVM